MKYFGASALANFWKSFQRFLYETCISIALFPTFLLSYTSKLLIITFQFHQIAKITVKVCFSIPCIGGCCNSIGCVFYCSITMPRHLFGVNVWVYWDCILGTRIWGEIILFNLQMLDTFTISHHLKEYISSFYVQLHVRFWWARIFFYFFVKGSGLGYLIGVGKKQFKLWRPNTNLSSLNIYLNFSLCYLVNAIAVGPVSFSWGKMR